MSFQTELDASLQHKVNLVVKIGTEYFSKHQVDSGLTIDSDKVGLVSGATVNPTSVDLRRIKTNVNSTSIKVLDKDATISALIGASDNTLIGEDIELHMGLITGSFAWADYVKINDYIVKSISKSNSFYTIRAVSQENRMQVPMFNIKGTLTTAINDSVTSIQVDTHDDIFQSANYARIDDEFIQYTGTTYSAGVTTLTGVTRGSLSSTAIAHTIGTETKEVTKLEVNPITMLLQVIISSGGGGTYDVLHNGTGIDENLIDVTAIELVRTNFFASDSFRLYLYDIDNALEWLEKELLFPNNLRFIITENGISVAVLDQSVVGASVPVLDTDNCLAKASWSASQDRIVNEFSVKWAWSEGLEKFTRITYFEDTTSKAAFGIRKGSDLEFKGVQADLSGANIVQDRGDRFLARFSTPQVQIGTTAFFKTYSNNAGDKVLFSHPDVPQEGGGLGINTELEIVSKAIDIKTGLVKFKLVYTSYYNLRRGLIAPSEIITAVTSQKIFTVGDVDHYKAGYFLELWDEVNGIYFSDAANEIDSVDTSTKQITMKSDFVTTLTTNVRIKFATYNDASDEQRARYGYIAPNTGFFADGTKAYQISI